MSDVDFLPPTRAAKLEAVVQPPLDPAVSAATRKRFA